MMSIGEITGLREPLPCERRGGSDRQAKVKYKSKGAAQAAIRALLKRPERVKDAGTLQEYKCPHCYYWHVGHDRSAADRQPNPPPNASQRAVPPAVESDNAVRYPFRRSHGSGRNRNRR